MTNFYTTQLWAVRENHGLLFYVKILIKEGNLNYEFIRK